jgi:beta-phosphoglucomutase-like phosphatase (HAD superfamily)
MLDADLIIFDCDGVLVDSEPITNRLLAQCVSEAGWAIDAAYSVQHFKGRNLHEIHAEVEQQVGRSLPTLLEDYRRICYQVFEDEGVPAIDGVHDLLDAIDEVIAANAHAAPHRCVATNAPMRKMRMTLTGSDLIQRFVHRDESERETMFSAYQIGKWKPEPDLFLHAAAKMGYAPQSCVVIEDSISGVRAAKAAGMKTIALAALTPADKLQAAGADRVVESHHELVDDFRSGQNR